MTHESLEEHWNEVLRMRPSDLHTEIGRLGMENYKLEVALKNVSKSHDSWSNKCVALQAENAALRARNHELAVVVSRYQQNNVENDALRAEAAELRAFKASVPWDALEDALQEWEPDLGGAWDFLNEFVAANRPQESP